MEEKLEIFLAPALSLSSRVSNDDDDDEKFPKINGSKGCLLLLKKCIHRNGAAFLDFVGLCQQQQQQTRG